MVAGADSISDLDLLRHGGMERLFAGVRAPSTLGTFLRLFTFGHVRQLDAVAAGLLARLAAATPVLPDAHKMVFVDLDDTERQTYGFAKQGAGRGYTGVNGLNALLAVISTPLSAPLIAATRLRRGSANSARGAAKLLADALATARRAGAAGLVLVRGLGLLRPRHRRGLSPRRRPVLDHRPPHPSVVRAITGIDEQAWVPIRYPHAIYDETEQRWVSTVSVTCSACHAGIVGAGGRLPGRPARSRGLAPPAAARSLDAHAVTTLQVPRALAGQLFLGAVGVDVNVAPDRTIPAATDPPRSALAAFGLDGEDAVGEHLDLPDQPFAAGMLTGSAGTVPQLVAPYPQRVVELHCLRGRVLGVRHTGVHSGHAPPVRCSAFTTAQGLVVAERRVSAGAEQQVVHGALARRRHSVRDCLGEGAQQHVDDPLAGLDIAGGGRRGKCGVHHRPFGSPHV